LWLHSRRLGHSVLGRDFRFKRRNGLRFLRDSQKKKAEQRSMIGFV